MDVVAAKAVFFRHQSKGRFFGRGVIFADAEPVRSKPEDPVSVFQYARDAVIGKYRFGVFHLGLWNGKCGEFLPVELKYPFHGADPEQAVPVNYQGPYIIVERALAQGIIGKGSPVIFGYPGIGAEPHIPGFVFHNTGYPSLAEAVFFREIDQRIAVVAHQPVHIGPEPKIAFFILVDLAQVLAKLPFNKEKRILIGGLVFPVQGIIGTAFHFTDSVLPAVFLVLAGARGQEDRRKNQEKNGEANKGLKFGIFRFCKLS